MKLNVFEMQSKRGILLCSEVPLLLEYKWKGGKEMEQLLLNLVPTLATVFLVTAYVPQVVQTYKTKNVEGISLSFWVLINIALTLMLINATKMFMVTGAWGYMVAESFNEGLAFVMLVMVIKYRKKKEK